MVLEKFSLKGKVALVTGAAQGIGLACVEAFLQAGAKVALLDKELTVLNKCVQSFKKKYDSLLSFHVDLREDFVIHQVVTDIVSHWGRLDIAVNNVGICHNAPAEDTSIESWDEVFTLNLRSMFLCCKSEFNAMKDNNGGKIINTASMASLVVPYPQKQASYNSSKAGVVQLTKSLASEWAEYNINVNCISPGIVKTELINSSELRPLVNKWLGNIPFGRLALVEDLQGAFVFLASDASRYMTGHNLIIDGGYTLR